MPSLVLSNISRCPQDTDGGHLSETILLPLPLRSDAYPARPKHRIRERSHSHTKRIPSRKRIEKHLQHPYMSSEKRLVPLPR